MPTSLGPWALAPALREKQWFETPPVDAPGNEKTREALEWMQCCPLQTASARTHKEIRKLEKQRDHLIFVRVYLLAKLQEVHGRLKNLEVNATFLDYNRRTLEAIAMSQEDDSVANTPAERHRWNRSDWHACEMYRAELRRRLNDIYGSDEE